MVPGWPGPLWEPHSMFGQIMEVRKSNVCSYCMRIWNLLASISSLLNLIRTLIGWYPGNHFISIESKLRALSVYKLMKTQKFELLTHFLPGVSRCGRKECNPPFFSSWLFLKYALVLAISQILWWDVFCVFFTKTLSNWTQNDSFGQLIPFHILFRFIFYFLTLQP